MKVFDDEFVWVAFGSDGKADAMTRISDVESAVHHAQEWLKEGLIVKTMAWEDMHKAMKEPPTIVLEGDKLIQPQKELFADKA